MMRIIGAVILVLALLALPVLADEVVLRDGQVLRGDIASYDRDAVIVKIGGIDYRVAAYAIDHVLLQQGYAPPLPTVAPNQVWSAGWAEAGPYAYAGLAGVGELRRQLEVTGAVVNLRNAPGLNFAVIDRVARGDRLTAISAVGGWYRILRNDATTAWIFGDLVMPLNVETGMMQGAAGYATAVTAPVPLPPAYVPAAAYAPPAGANIDYARRQQFIEELMRRRGVPPATN